MTTASSASARDRSAKIALREWMPTLIAVGIAAAAFGAAFAHEVKGAVAVWIESTAYNHCFLVLPMAVFLLWDRRATIATLRPQPVMWPLLAMAPVVAVWIAAALLDILEGEQLAAMALFEILLLCLLGLRTFRALLGPLLFLFFLVPFGAFLVPGLQQATTRMAVAGLRLVHIPVFTSGFVIQIPEGTFEVAQACAGLRFLIASIVFGCFFALVIYRSPARRLAFIVASLVVPILANGIRAFGLIALAHIAGSAAAVETDHILYGWLFFSLVTLLLIALGIGFRDRRAPAAAPAVSPSVARAARPALRSGSAAAIGIVIAVAGPAYLAMLDRSQAAVSTDVAWSSAPAGTAWKAEPRPAGGWRPSGAGASHQSFRVFADGGEGVSQFVATYRLRARDGKLTQTVDRIADETTWHILRRGRASAVASGQEIMVDTAQIGGKGKERLVWWFYIVGKRATASLTVAKLLQARAVLEGGPRFGAYVAVSTVIDGSVDAAAKRLARFLQVMRPTPRWPQATG